MDSVYLAGDGTLYTADEGYGDQNRYESADGGAHWTQAGGSFPKADPASATPYVWASSADGGFVIGGSSDTLMASTNRGASWYDTGSTQVATGGWRGNGFSGLLGTRVAFDRAQPGDIFLAGSDSGNLLRSTDAGVSWTRPLAGWDNYGGGYDVQTGGAAGNVVYEVLGEAGAFNGVGVSTDSGRTWSVHVGGALPARYSVGSGQGSIAIASSDGATAYAVLPDEQLYMTTDTGSTWTHVSLPSPAYAVASNADFRTIYVATDAGVEQIANQGQPVLLSSSPLNLHRLVDRPRWKGLWRRTAGQWRPVRSVDQPDGRLDAPRRATRRSTMSRSIRGTRATSSTSPMTTRTTPPAWPPASGSAATAAAPSPSTTPGCPCCRILSVAFDPWIPGRVVIGTDGRGYLADPTAASADPSTRTRLGPTQYSDAPGVATRIAPRTQLSAEAQLVLLAISTRERRVRQSRTACRPGRPGGPRRSWPHTWSGQRLSLVVPARLDDLGLVDLAGAIRERTPARREQVQAEATIQSVDHPRTALEPRGARDPRRSPSRA